MVPASYDVESRVPGTGKLRLIGVKGRVSGATTITVTKNEILYSLNKPDTHPRHRRVHRRQLRLADLPARAEAPRWPPAPVSVVLAKRTEIDQSVLS